MNIISYDTHEKLQKVYCTLGAVFAIGVPLTLMIFSGAFFVIQLIG